MARPIRIQYPGATYHVMARGSHGQAIFQDDQDRQRFLETLGEACAKTGIRIHAYVLMGNHYHLLVETPEGNLVAGMKGLQGAYTQRYNGRHQLFGHLFQGRYKAVPVEGEGTSGPAKAAHDEAGAERLLAGGLRAMGLSEAAWAGLSKGAAPKVVLAWWLREHTAVPLRWVSERLARGHYTRVTQAVSRMQRCPGRGLQLLRRKLERLPIGGEH